MSARVMLMVRNSRGRFVCLTSTTRVWSTYAWGRSRAYHLRRNPRRRWWIVDADSADAARKVIEHFERDPDARCVHGRVRANGGKR